MDKINTAPAQNQPVKPAEQKEQHKATYFTQELAKVRKAKLVIRLILVVPVCVVFATQLMSIEEYATPLVVLFSIAYVVLELMLYLRHTPANPPRDSEQLAAITQRAAASAVGASIGGFVFLTYNQLLPETNDILAVTAVACGAGLGFVLGTIVDSVFSPLNKKAAYYTTYLNLKFQKGKGIISQSAFDRYDERNNSRHHFGD